MCQQRGLTPVIGGQSRQGGVEQLEGVVALARGSWTPNGAPTGAGVCCSAVCLPAFPLLALLLAAQESLICKRGETLFKEPSPGELWSGWGSQVAPAHPLHPILIPSLSVGGERGGLGSLGLQSCLLPS